MKARTLTLSAADVERLHAGYTVGVLDSAGDVVCVCLQERPGDGGLRLTVSEEDLKLAAGPEGLVCADDEWGTNWTVYVQP